MRTMHSHGLIILDVLCITFLSVHLTDIDVTLKVVASSMVIITNLIVLFRKNKK